MASQNLFYKYYDTLFSDKDYDAEIQSILKICKKHSAIEVKDVLDIGCGTGNHSIAFAKANLNVMGVDINEEMIRIAAKKVNEKNCANVTTEVCTLDQLQGCTFDLCVALFNVISYITNVEALDAFFHSAQPLPRQGGLFIFDCWNGDAVIQDPPKEKKTEKQLDEGRLVSHLTCSTDVEARKAVLNYHLQLLDGDDVKEDGNYSFGHTLWSPQQIKESLNNAGFTLIDIMQPFTSQTADLQKDWKIMFVCRR